MVAVNFIVAGFLVFLGILMKYYKAYDLISGYNMSSREEKDYMIQKGLGDFMGRQLMLLGAAWLVGGFLKWAGFMWGIEVGIALFIIILLYTIAAAQKFTPPPEFYENLGKPKPVAARWQKYILWGAALFVLVIIGLVAWSSLPSNFILEENQLRISGNYGISLNYSAIESIQLKEELPPLVSKTNGLDMGSIRKGYFQVEGMGEVLLFLGSMDVSPYLVIKTKDHPETVIINFDSPSETERLYEQLNQRLD